MQEDARALQAAAPLIEVAAAVAALVAAVEQPDARVCLLRLTAAPAAAVALGHLQKQGDHADSVLRRVAVLHLQQLPQPVHRHLRLRPHPLYSASAFLAGMRQFGYLALANRLAVARHGQRADSFHSLVGFEVFLKAMLLVGVLAAAAQEILAAEAGTLPRHSRLGTP